MKKILTINIAISLLLTVSSAFISQTVSAQTAPEPESVNSKLTPLPLDDVRLFVEVFTRIKELYVDEISDEELIEHAINGMVSGLDPHSSYVVKESYKELKVGAQGKFGGVGIEIIEDTLGIKVIAPLDESPASDADIRAGDIIIKVDDTITKGLTINRAIKLMRGDPDTNVVLTLLRQGEQTPLVKTLTREAIKIRTVRAEMLRPDFAYLRISQFQSATAASLREKLTALQAENEAPLKGVLLDLRNNPGGLLNSAVAVSDVFLDSGNIVSTKGRRTSSESNYTAAAKDYIDGVPMIVLINQGSASASEIVAGALQDNKRALVVGTQSFGKGSVQTIISLAEDKALKLTTARYYTPAGVSIQAKGITPDVLVEQRELKQRSSTIDYNEASLNKHLTSSEGADKTNKKKISAEQQDRLEQDFQLQEALKILQGIALYQR